MAVAQRQIPIIKTKSLSLRVDRLWSRQIKLLVLFVLVTVLGETGNSAFAQCCQFALVRYNATGSLDTHFGQNGKVLTNFLSSRHEAAHAMRIDSRYRIVVAGEAYIVGEGSQFAVARYRSNGTLDTSFGGGDGKVITNFVSSTEERAYETARAIAIDRNGKIVLAGSARINDGNQFALARYNSDGTRDTDFGGGDGKVVTDFSASPHEGANAVAIDANGKIVVAGAARFIDPGSRFALARYNSDGSLDTSFGDDGTGMVVTNFASSTDEWANAIAIDSNGKILLAGQADVGGTGNTQFALARYNSDGRLDTTFGGGHNGKVVTDFTSSTNDAAKAIALIPSGKIILAGYANVGGNNYQFAVARYNSDGRLDTTFGGGHNGKVVTNFRTNELALMGIAEAAAAVAVDMSDQEYRIVAAGWAYVTE